MLFSLHHVDALDLVEALQLLEALHLVGALHLIALQLVIDTLSKRLKVPKDH